MRSVNKVILVGNVTRDPDVRETQSGQVIVTFGMATNRQWKNATGDKQDAAEFHELVAWSRLADLCSKYVKKGKLLYVEGYLKTRSWDTPEGVRRFKTEVVVQDLIMLEKRDGSDEYDEVPMEDEPADVPAKTEVAEQAPAAEVAEDAPAAEDFQEASDDADVVDAADPNADFSF